MLPISPAKPILDDLDKLRDRRFAKEINDEDYHLEWNRLWDELRKADRTEGLLTKKKTQDEQRLAKKKAKEERRVAREEHERRPKVYCDGCCEPGQPLGIGVYSSDCGIEICLQLDQPGTNNVAECLGAITALEECKKKGIRGIRLLSDSELVVNWTTGVYTIKSQTARKYVPKIRQLMAEVGATIEWIPGSQNLADKYSRNRQMYPDNLTPMEMLKTIPVDRLTVQDFLGVKSGWDEFSKMKKEKILQMLDGEEWQKIAAAFDKEKYHLSVARWRLRGLPLETAIRKVEVDREIGHDIAEKNAAGWTGMMMNMIKNATLSLLNRRRFPC